MEMLQKEEDKRAKPYYGIAQISGRQLKSLVRLLIELCSCALVCFLKSEEQ